MFKRLLIFAVVLITSIISTYAQWDVQFSDYTTLKSYYNPAVAGTDGMLDVAMAYSIQMAGYDDAPRTMYLGATLPVYFLGPHHGAGVSLYSDEIGIFKTQQINLQYACNLKMGKHGRLAIGVQGAMLNETIDTKDMKLEQENDPAFPSSSVDGDGIDLGVGAYYFSPKYWLGIAAQHLTAPSLEIGETYQLDISRTYNFMCGGNIKLKNSLLTLQPSFLIQTDLESWREDVQCKVTYEYEQRKFYVGVGYSPKTSVTALIGGYFRGIQLGYSYQMYTGGIGIQYGSHEITMSYATDLDLFKKGRNRHQSTRFL